MSFGALVETGGERALPAMIRSDSQPNAYSVASSLRMTCIPELEQPSQTAGYLRNELVRVDAPRPNNCLQRLTVSEIRLIVFFSVPGIESSRLGVRMPV